MGHMRIKGNECEYKERYRGPKKQVVHEINEDKMMTELMKELTVIKKTNEISDHLLSWAKKQRSY